MSTWTPAVILASEGAEGGTVHPVFFGLAGFGALILLLIITLMINVDR